MDYGEEPEPFCRNCAGLLKQIELDTERLIAIRKALEPLVVGYQSGDLVLPREAVAALVAYMKAVSR